MLDCSVLSASFQTLTCKLAVKGSKFGLLNSWSQSATMDFVRSEFCLFMTCSSLRRGFKKQFIALSCFLHPLELSNSPPASLLPQLPSLT